MGARMANNAPPNPRVTVVKHAMSAVSLFIVLRAVITPDQRLLFKMHISGW